MSRLFSDVLSLLKQELRYANTINKMIDRIQGSLETDINFPVVFHFLQLSTLNSDIIDRKYSRHGVL